MKDVFINKSANTCDNLFLFFFLSVHNIILNSRKNVGFKYKDTR